MKTVKLQESEGSGKHECQFRGFVVRFRLLIRCAAELQPEMLLGLARSLPNSRKLPRYAKKILQILV